MVSTAPAFPHRGARSAVVGRGPAVMSAATPGSPNPAPETFVAAHAEEGRR